MATGPVQELTVAVTGDAALAQVASGYDNVNAAAAKLNQTHEILGTTTEELSARQRSAASAFNTIARAYDPVLRSQQQMEREQRTLNRALQQGVIEGNNYATMLATIKGRHEQVVASAAAAAKGTAAVTSGGLQGWQKKQLGMQASQFFQESLAGGFSASNIGRSALMQGMDVLPMFPGLMGGLTGGAAIAGGVGVGALAGGVGLAYAFGKDVQAFKDGSATIRGIVVGVIADIGNLFKTGAMDTLHYFEGLVTSAMDTASKSAASNQTTLKDYLNNTIGQVVTFFDVINVKASDLPGLLADAAISVVNATLGVMEKLINGALTALETAINTVQSVLDDLSTQAGALVAKVPGMGDTGRAMEGERKAVKLPTVQLGQFDQTGAIDAAKKRAAGIIERDMGYDYIGAGKTYLEGAGKRGDTIMRGWGDKAQNEKAKDQVKTINAETDALKAQAAAYGVDKNAREDALRVASRQLDLQKALLALDKASPNDKAAVAAATKAKWAAEDAQIQAQRNAEQRDAAQAQALQNELLTRGAGAYNVEKSAREAALRTIEREITLRRALAETPVAQQSAVRARLAGQFAAEDVNRTAKVNSELMDTVKDSATQRGFDSRSLDIRQSTTSGSPEQKQKLADLAREIELYKVLKELGPDVSDATRAAVVRETNARQDLLEKMAKENDAASNKELQRQRSVSGAFGDYFAEATNSAKSFGQMMVSTTSMAVDTIGTVFDKLASGAEVSFKEITKSFATMVAKMLAEQGILMALGAIGKAFGLTVVAPSGQTVATNSPQAAHYFGAVYSDGQIVKHYEMGGVIGQRTVVPTAELGEKGQKEGILPLRQMPDGRLGVHASIGGGGDVFHIETPVTVIVKGDSGKVGTDEHEKIGQQFAAVLEKNVDALVDKRLAQQRRTGGDMQRTTTW